MTTGSRWPAVLDAFEASLRPDGPPFRPADGLGPVPPELVGRAEELLRAARARENELVAALTSAWQRGALVGRLRATHAPDRRGSAYVDAHG